MATQANTRQKAGNTGTPGAFSKEDLASIRRELRRFLVVAGVAIVLVGGCRALVYSQSHARDKAQQQREQAVAKASEIESEQREIQDFHPKYVALKQRGFIGDENRLEWVELIERIRRSGQINSISYEIDVRQDYEADAAVTMGSLSLRASRVRLNAKLLHEGDFVQVLNGVRGRFVLVPHSCAIRRNTESLAGPLAPRLEAECTMYWPTVSVPPNPAAPA